MKKNYQLYGDRFGEAAKTVIRFCLGWISLTGFIFGGSCSQNRGFSISLGPRESFGQGISSIFLGPDELYSNNLNDSDQPHYVLMEYEAWFGPKAIKWNPLTSIFPLLSSSNMWRFGGGYDSQDETVIEQHFRWFMDMDIDGIILDHTNNIACTFTPETFNQEIPQIALNRYLQNGRKIPPQYEHYFQTLGWMDELNSFDKSSVGDQQILSYLSNKWGCRPGDAFQVAMNAIKENNSNLFRLFDQFRQKYGRTIKIVVASGGYEPTGWEALPSHGNQSAMDLQIEFYHHLFQKYPQLQLSHEGKPLLLSYFGAPTAIQNYSSLDARSQNQAWNSFTVRKMGGYMSNQLGITGYQGIGTAGLPKYREIWTWIDRLRADPPHNLMGPSYAESRSGNVVEAFTVTMANPAVDGWGDFENKIPTEHGDLRQNGVTFTRFMDLARQLQPQFLIINQFNEYSPPDQGWDEDTTNDIEPTNWWGTRYVDLVRNEIAVYRSQLPQGGTNPEPPPGTGTTNPLEVDLPFTSAQGHTELWPASLMLDNDPNSCYSSEMGDQNNSRYEFIAAWIGGTSPQQIKHLEITPRIYQNNILSFPPVFDLYVTSSDNSTWVHVKTWHQSELTLNEEGRFQIPVSISFPTWGIHLVPRQLGLDDYQNHYFQLCGLKAFLD